MKLSISRTVLTLCLSVIGLAAVKAQSLYEVSEMPVGTVSIDIIPGDDTNTIHLSSVDIISVAILSSDVFDALTIIPESVSLAGANTALVGKSDQDLCYEQEVTGDWISDLVCEVYLESYLVEPGTTRAVMEAQTYDGYRILGEADLHVVADDVTSAPANVQDYAPEIQDYTSQSTVERAAAWNAPGGPEWVDPNTGDRSYSSGYEGGLNPWTY